MIAVVEKKDDFSADLFLETPGCQNLSDQITLRKKSARLLAKTNNRVLHRLERVLYPSRSLRTAEDRLLQDRREDQHGRASNQIIPEVTDIGRCEQDEDECLCKERREEHGRSGSPTNEESCQKKTKNAAIEQRTQNVACFNQIFNQNENLKDPNGHKIPHNCNHLCHDNK